MPFKDRIQRNQASIRSQQKRALRGRKCQGCAKNPAEVYYRAGEGVRPISLCQGCVDKLTAVK